MLLMLLSLKILESRTERVLLSLYDDSIVCSLFVKLLRNIAVRSLFFHVFL